MKKLSLPFLLLTWIALSTACKKETSPELEVTVVDSVNKAVPNVWIKTSVDGANTGILNSRVIDSAKTDAFGKAFFKYENTILIDIALYETWRSKEIIDSASVLLETKRLKSGNENVTEKKLVFR